MSVVQLQHLSVLSPLRCCQFIKQKLLCRSIKDFAQQVQENQLHCLVNNAGIFIPQDARSEEGFEVHAQADASKLCCQCHIPWPATCDCKLTLAAGPLADHLGGQSLWVSVVKSNDMAAVHYGFTL